MGSPPVDIAKKINDPVYNITLFFFLA